ncbi:MAG TPA: hypothetical protein VIV60_07460, partial [Polyangiaceae bacterium]
MGCSGQRNTQRSTWAIASVSAVLIQSCRATEYNVGDGVNQSHWGGKPSAGAGSGNSSGQSEASALGGTVGQLTFAGSGTAG